MATPKRPGRKTERFKPPSNTPVSAQNLRLCKRVKQLRLQQKITQGEFAESIGVHTSTIKAIETGRMLPTLDTLRSLASVYKVAYEWLLDGLE